MSSGIYRLSRLWGRRNQLGLDVGGAWSGAAQVLQGVPRGNVEREEGPAISLRDGPSPAGAAVHQRAQEVRRRPT